MSVIPKKPAPLPPQQQDEPSLPLNTILESEEEEEEAFEKFRVMSNLPKFEVKLFKNEPHLQLSDKVSKDLSKCEKFSLASVQLVTMELKVHISSKSEVEVQASMKDISLCDLREETKKRNTG